MTGDSPIIKEEQVDYHGMGGFNGQYGQHFTSAGSDFNVDPSNLTMNGHGSYGMGLSSIQDDELEELGFLDNNFQSNGIENPLNQNVFQGHMQQSIPQSFGQPQQQHMGSYQGDVYQHSATLGSPLNGYHRKMYSMDQGQPRSPMTPTSKQLNIGTPDSHLYNQQLHAQAKATANQWNSTPGSGHSWLGDSPLPSPHAAGHMRPGITDIMGLGGMGHSLPAKIEGQPNPSFITQEAKKKRRRESHNLVERRRRDNINERIQDLSRLVPQHRLEDEKVRKHISANGPLSPSGMSPPQATSLLAGGSGRRAASGLAGNITQGLPMEEKDKGPNKGDILNGAVSWMRDTMWYLYAQHEQLERARQEFEAAGLKWPFEETEDDRRMKTELIDAIERNGVDNFHYSRGPGSGLRVPKHTNYSGEPLDRTPKEDDEFGMDMG